MSFGTLWKWRHCLEWRHQQQQLVVAVIEQRRRERIRQSERFFLSGSIPESSISAVHPPRPLLRSPEGHSAIIWKLPPGGSTSRSFIFFFFRVQSSGFVGGNAATSRGLKIRRFQVCSFVCNEASNYLKIGNAALAFSLFFWESSSLAENLATFRLPGFPISPAERIFLLFAANFYFHAPNPATLRLRRKKRRFNWLRNAVAVVAEQNCFQRNSVSFRRCWSKIYLVGSATVTFWLPKDRQRHLVVVIYDRWNRTWRN